MNPKSQARALRYRRLANAEPDKSRAALLYKLAEEAEQGVLCTVDRMYKSENEARMQGSQKVA